MPDMPGVTPKFPSIELPHLAAVDIPPMRRVRIKQRDNPQLDDLVASIDAELSGNAALFELPKGAEIAVAVGSRGIACIDIIVRTAVAWLKTRGFSPFIVPAMGSHGGGTADGQTKVLSALGITQETIGCPVRATMETATYGEIEGGIACHFDAFAAAADGILVINRVKAHTSFPRPIESGLTKMLAVGLGKAEGARWVHLLGPRGLAEILPALAERIVERAPLVAGLALVENAAKQIMHAEIVPPAEFATTDKRLLVQSKAAMARLPFARLDGLIIEEIGKDVSGAGIDPAISGRTDIRGVDNPAEPFIHKIAVLDMTRETGGNGMGTGMADYIPRHVADRLDLKAMYMNAVTATILEKAFIPIVLPDDLTVIRALVATCWVHDVNAMRICQIRSSMHLSEIAVTEPLFEELREADLLLSHDGPESLRFDASGRLQSRFGNGDSK